MYGINMFEFQAQKYGQHRVAPFIFVKYSGIKNIRVSNFLSNAERRGSS